MRKSEDALEERGKDECTAQMMNFTCRVENAPKSLTQIVAMDKELRIIFLESKMKQEVQGCVQRIACMRRGLYLLLTGSL